jgi:hypothetical protein
MVSAKVQRSQYKLRQKYPGDVERFAQVGEPSPTVPLLVLRVVEE